MVYGTAEQVPSVEEAEEGKAAKIVPAEVYSDGSSWQDRPKAEKINCPFLKSLYQNGVLVPDEEGAVPKEQVLAALAGTGLEDERLAALFTGNANPLKLFEMKGNVHLEHTLSTGILDPLPDPEKFEEFATFSDKDGRFYASNLADAFWHFWEKPNDRNKDRPLPEGADLTLVWGLTLDVFGQQTTGLAGWWKGKYLTVEQLRGHFLQGKYPSGWKVHPWSLATSLRETLGVAGPCGCCCRRRPRLGEKPGSKACDDPKTSKASIGA